MSKKALITGITGQDGSYLAEFLLQKKYKVDIAKKLGLRIQKISSPRIIQKYKTLISPGQTPKF